MQYGLPAQKLGKEVAVVAHRTQIKIIAAVEFPAAGWRKEAVEIKEPSLFQGKSLQADISKRAMAVRQIGTELIGLAGGQFNPINAVGSVASVPPLMPMRQRRCTTRFNRFCPWPVNSLTTTANRPLI